MTIIDTSYPEDSISQDSSTSSGSYTLVISSSTMCLDLGLRLIQISHLGLSTQHLILSLSMLCFFPSTTGHYKKKLLWLRLTASQAYGYQQKYLDKISTAWPFSKLKIVDSVLGSLPFSAMDLGLGLQYRTWSILLWNMP